MTGNIAPALPQSTPAGPRIDRMGQRYDAHFYAGNLGWSDTYFYGCDGVHNHPLDKQIEIINKVVGLLNLRNVLGLSLNHSSLVLILDMKWKPYERKR
ncbi:MAG: hypothetical protein P4L50_21695 [Anaerolineaceae bacterium]|nr:hypothetical protein [Anaerolineaceae bacterium]